MGRPNQSAQRREQFLPLIAGAFAELGYRRSTTAVLAERCGVQENILYRLWEDKRAMFLAAVDHVYRGSEEVWSRLLAAGDETGSVAEKLLTYESRHLGEHGLYRIIFAGLGETDDPEIHAALRRMYFDFHRFVRDRIAAHRAPRAGGSGEGTDDVSLAAWALLGVGTVASIGRELGLMDERERSRLLGEVGKKILDG